MKFYYIPLEIFFEKLRKESREHFLNEMFLKGITTKSIKKQSLKSHEIFSSLQSISEGIREEIAKDFFEGIFEEISGGFFAAQKDFLREFFEKYLHKICV